MKRELTAIEKVALATLTSIDHQIKELQESEAEEHDPDINPFEILHEIGNSTDATLAVIENLKRPHPEDQK